MAAEYIVINGRAEAEFEEKRSRFIGLAAPLERAEDFEPFLAACKLAYPEARHYCYAYKCWQPQSYQRYSDAGEPQGTAGLPILEVLNKQGLDSGALVVVRYFGGILLGAGGLSRAYGRAAAAALQLAPCARLVRRRVYACVLAYAQAQRLEQALRKLPEVGEVQCRYEAAVRLEICPPPELLPQLERLLAELSSGQSTWEALENREIRLPLC